MPLVLGLDLSSIWVAVRAGRTLALSMLRYAPLILVPHFRATSVFGFALLINMIAQALSGALLALLFVPDPSFVMTFREECINEVW